MNIIGLEKKCMYVNLLKSIICVNILIGGGEDCK